MFGAHFFQTCAPSPENSKPKRFCQNVIVARHCIATFIRSGRNLSTTLRTHFGLLFTTVCLKKHPRHF